MAYNEASQHALPGGGRLSIKFNANDDTSSSGGSSPDPSMRVILGRSLTLTEFVDHIETESGQVVESMYARYHRRPFVMPVGLPQANADRCEGRGDELVEDIVYNLAGRQRLSIHGVIEFFVRYANKIAQDVTYHF